MLPIDQKIDRAERLLRMLEADAPLLEARVAPLSVERQRSAKSYAERLAERTRAEIRELLEERNLLTIAEQTPAAAD
jgi:phosphoribosylaminoimidazole carboxylase (NCAIR synthetase)